MLDFLVPCSRGVWQRREWGQQWVRQWSTRGIVHGSNYWHFCWSRCARNSFTSRGDWFCCLLVSCYYSILLLKHISCITTRVFVTFLPIFTLALVTCSCLHVFDIMLCPWWTKKRIYIHGHTQTQWKTKTCIHSPCMILTAVMLVGSGLQDNTVSVRYITVAWLWLALVPRLPTWRAWDWD